MLASWWRYILTILIFSSICPTAYATDLEPVTTPAIQHTIDQPQVEQWLLQAIANNNRTLAFQIAGKKFSVRSADGQIFSVDGLNIDLGYRGPDGRGMSLFQILKTRYRWYARDPQKLHRHLSYPNETVYTYTDIQQLTSSPALVPANTSSFRVIAMNGLLYHEVDNKLYQARFATVHGVPQEILMYSAQATTAYRQGAPWQLHSSYALN